LVFYRTTKVVGYFLSPASQALGWMGDDYFTARLLSFRRATRALDGWGNKNLKLKRQSAKVESLREDYFVRSDANPAMRSFGPSGFQFWIFSHGF